MNKANERSSIERAALIAEYADDMKGQDIETLDVQRKTSATRYFVICTGTSDVHVNAIAERVNERLRADHSMKPLRKSQKANDGWIVLDYGDVVFHVMLDEKRQYYDLESLWESIQNDPNLIVE